MHSCEHASYIDVLNEYDSDLQDALLEDLEVKRCLQKPADIQPLLYRLGDSEFQVYLPNRTGRPIFCMVHFPGGITKHNLNKDRSWCSNLTKACKAADLITIDVNYPASPQKRYPEIQNDCVSVLQYIRQLLKENIWSDYDTSESPILLGGSSFGGTLALGIASHEVLNDESIAGIHVVSPVVDTNPDLTNQPWGTITRTFGLTVENFLAQLDYAFEGLPSVIRNSSQYNPSKMSRLEFKWLPYTRIWSASDDILACSIRKFAETAGKHNPKIIWSGVKGLHMVKDMFNTAAGRHVFEECLVFLEEVVRSNTDKESIVYSRG